MPVVVFYHTSCEKYERLFHTEYVIARCGSKRVVKNVIHCASHTYLYGADSLHDIFDIDINFRQCMKNEFSSHTNTRERNGIPIVLTNALT
jgi:hypothetical protein